MWDSLFGSPELRIELMIGKITHVDTQRGVYLIQPMDAPDLRKGDTAVAGGIGDTSKAFVKNAEVYSINDYVLYARVASNGIHSTTIMRAAIILGRAPAFVTAYKDVTELRDISKNEHEVTDYYELLALLFDRKSPTAEPDAQFIARSWLEERIGGDKILEGTNVILRVSDELIQLLGKRCGIHVNSIDSSVVLHGVTLNATAVGYAKRSAIVNDAVVHIERSAGSLSSAYDAKNDIERFTREAIESDLIYGSVETLYSPTKAPLTQVSNLYDGTHRISSVAGMLFEKPDGITAYSPKLQTSIQYDDKIIATAKDDRAAFDRVSKSDNWENRSSAGSKSDFIRTPGDRTNADGVELADVAGDSIPGFKGKASMGFLPNGGFVIRDAWGSEIRMCDGDIQIAAARNIQYIIGQDAIEIVGGAKVATASSGIELNARKGNVDINADMGLNLNCKLDMSMSSGGDLRALADKNAIVKAETGIAAVKGINAHIISEQETTITGSKAYVAGQSDVMLASSAAVVRCAGSVTLAGSAVDVLGDLRVDDATFPDSEVGTVRIKCGKGHGAIQAANTLHTGGSIVCNKSITVCDGGFFGKLSTADAKEVEGGLGFGGKLRQSPKPATISGATSGSSPVSDSLKSALLLAGATTKSGILATMFTIAARVVNLIKPLFSGKHRNIVKIADSVSVDIGGKAKYIYPGETFWKSSGVVTTKGSNPAENLLAEELLDRATQGASDIQLSS